MKHLTLICVFWSTLAFAQHSDTVFIGSLPNEGLLLNKAWQYCMSNKSIQQIQTTPTIWKDIDPSWDFHDSLPSDAVKGIGWMKLKFKITDSLKQELFAIQIQQSIAAEYYLNGQLLTSYGVISAISTLVRASDSNWKPVAFPVVFDSINTLLIRFSVQPKSRYTQIYETTNPIAFIQLKHHQKAIDAYTRLIKLHLKHIYSRVGICLMIVIFHLSFYLFYPIVKANLWFALALFLTIIADLLQVKFWFFTDFINEKYWLALIVLSLSMLCSLLVTVSISQFLHRKFDWIDKFIALLFIPLVLLSAWVYGWGWRPTIIFQLLFLINLIRFAVLSHKTNKTNALIIGIGAVVTIILLSVFISMGFFENVPFNLSVQWQRMVFYLLMILAMPIALSFLLAREFAQTTRSLALKLSEVEALSAQTLAQEKEKKELLAAQNETLEGLVVVRTAALKASQAQLIQSEKLASLGELTAGIAHEIQNPLNFVNNFSELSVELAQELKAEIKKPDLDKGLIEELATDLATNQGKINHHGQRASSIVKGMLEHSRASTGVKEPTDLNALADEFLRLAYHGLRAKDNSFNATLETHFDSDLPKISVIPQDIGRVLLNLINNAFYAVNQFATTVETLHATSLPYQPTVIVTTKHLENAIEICIQDNGNGIPEAIKDKIFQPFFTTKPTGQGTGLGLSLAYDIVTKGHGGTLEVDSTAEHGTIFTMKIPI